MKYRPNNTDPILGKIQTCTTILKIQDPLVSLAILSTFKWESQTGLVGYVIENLSNMSVISIPQGQGFD